MTDLEFFIKTAIVFFVIGCMVGKWYYKRHYDKKMREILKIFNVEPGYEISAISYKKKE